MKIMGSSRCWSTISKYAPSLLGYGKSASCTSVNPCKTDLVQIQTHSLKAQPVLALGVMVIYIFLVSTNALLLWHLRISMTLQRIILVMTAMTSLTPLPTVLLRHLTHTIYFRLGMVLFRPQILVQLPPPTILLRHLITPVYFRLGMVLLRTINTAKNCLTGF